MPSSVITVDIQDSCCPVTNPITQTSIYICPQITNKPTRITASEWLGYHPWGIIKCLKVTRTIRKEREISRHKLLDIGYWTI